MRTFVVHDWLYTYAGSERVLESILRCVPVQRVFTLVDFLADQERHFLRGTPVTTSFLQKMPFSRTQRRLYLPLMPLAVESLDVSAAELIISSSAAIAKGVLTHGEQLHLCYCHSPARYAWDLTRDYLEHTGLRGVLKGALAQAVFHYFRLWDVTSSPRVDYFIANSRYTGRRLRRFYGRESTVIYPPVDVARFPLQEKKESFFVTVSRLVPYKKVDLIAAACTQAGKKLVVVGEGPELPKIKAQARGEIEVLGHQPNQVVVDLVRRAQAFIFAAQEEFGIVAVEAQAAGTPVIAYGAGGSLETVQGVFAGVRPQPVTTGIFFREQTVPSLLEALEWFEKHREDLEPQACRANAVRFAQSRFEDEFTRFVADRWEQFQSGEGHQPRGDRGSSEKSPRGKPRPGPSLSTPGRAMSK
jgi:glycosyltransferase involved in cell wall biosynthesis